jgi:hypothetical protein
MRHGIGMHDRFEPQHLTKEDILRKIIHFGGFEEYKVYSHLMNMLPDSRNNDCLKKLKDEVIKKIYPARIQNRLNSSVHEVVQFRIEFEFSK